MQRPMKYPSSRPVQASKIQYSVFLSRLCMISALAMEAPLNRSPFPLDRSVQTATIRRDFNCFLMDSLYMNKNKWINTRQQTNTFFAWPSFERIPSDYWWDPAMQCWFWGSKPSTAPPFFRMWFFAGDFNRYAMIRHLHGYGNFTQITPNYRWCSYSTWINMVIFPVLHLSFKFCSSLVHSFSCKMPLHCIDVFAGGWSPEVRTEFFRWQQGKALQENHQASTMW